MSARAAAARSCALLSVLAGLLLGGCGSTTTTVITHHELRLREDEFRILPHRTSVPPGRLKIVVSNDGVLAHNLVLERAGAIIVSIPTILPGAIGGPVKVTLAPGTYTLASTLSNQSDLGMMSTLVVRSH